MDLFEDLGEVHPALISSTLVTEASSSTAGRQPIGGGLHLGEVIETADHQVQGFG